MTSLRSSSTHQPLASSSAPPSPIVEEEDLAKASAWDDEDTSTLVSAKWKGKGRQRDDDDDDDRTIDGDEVHHETGEYPPMAEEDLESRKIEQNLKRWETLEKQRRKKARESRASTKSEPPSSSPGSSSTFSVSGVGRRASQLWSGRAKSRTDRTHPHQVLENVDESLPMDETGPPSASSPADTPRNSTGDTPRMAAASSPPPPLPPPHEDNPFDNPAYTERESEPDALMTAASPGSIPPTPKAAANGNGAPERPILQVQGPSYIKHPPPKPLDLPVPASPPSQPGNPQPQLEIEEEEGKRKQWWTEWLCGCREDGDDQAGRTNPME